MEQKKKSAISRFWKMQESGVLIATIVFVIVVICINQAFISKSNIFNVLRSSGYTLITALGMTLVFISGGLDISVGSTLALGSTVGAMAAQAGLPVPIAVLLGCLAGLAVGLFNGFTIVQMQIPPLIVTLGTMYAGRGVVYILTKGVAIYPLPKSFQAIEQTTLLDIPMIVIIGFVLAVIAHIVLSKTTFGRSVYAVGGNIEAARLSGIRIRSTSIATYAITGVCAAFTGVMMAARLGSGQASSGEGFEMTVIAAVIIGGTSATGGSGTILGTAIGAIFMNVLENSMTLMKVSVYWQKVVIGMILIAAVILDQYKRRRAMRADLKSMETKSEAS
ncbi:ABC transporter permease [Ruminococcus gauvreauii]|uniref:ABC transporter permease n=1 Tax=Ruminococcus gauvreauii TaxID=438033 RepID=A0ABY5VLM2_9FIRM|nr:ABC transporter permease [Ruminococcus gauvreauii]UWP61091.1 ABC transporter permease [Ruminococcus gauvreauii]